MFSRVLEVFTDLFDAATACALAAEATPEGTVRRGFLDGAVRELCAADELLTRRRRDDAIDRLLSACCLLRDAVRVDVVVGMAASSGVEGLDDVDIAAVALGLVSEVAGKIAAL